MEHVTDVDGVADAAPTPARKPRRKALLIGGAVVVAALAATGITAGVLVHQEQQRAEYTAVVKETNELREEAAVLALGTDLSTVLSVKELAEAKGVADRLKQLGGTADPVFTSEQAKALKSAGESIAKALPTEPVSEDAQAVADQATKELKDAGVKVSQWTGTEPGTLGDVLSWIPGDVESVKAGEYTPERLDAAKKELAKAERAVDDATTELDAVEAYRAGVSETVAEALKSVQDAGAGAPKQAPAVIAISQSVPDKHGAVTASAKAAADAAKATEISPDSLIVKASTKTEKPAEKVDPVEVSDAALVTMLSVKLKAYADASAAAKSAEAEAVAQAAAAEAAAAAAASGAGGYTDPSTGGWVPAPSYGGGGGAGGGGGWTPPAPGGGGGGGWTPPAPGGGGGGTPGGGYVPPPATCPPQPGPGWSPAGSSGGCTIWAPPGGADDW